MMTQEKTMLYLTDFPSKITNQDIQEFLSEYMENITNISKVNQDQNLNNKEKRKQLAFRVLFKNFESANKCRKEMNLRKLRNKSIRIMWDESDSSITHNTKNNLFFKGIPKSTTPREVYEYFLQFGDISSCKMTEDDNGAHYGYGYITYYSPDDAQKALENTNNKNIFDSIIEIKYFQKRNERAINSEEVNKQKIYVSNLPEKFTTENLKKLCSEYGEVKSCNIFIDNLKKNFGIVQFSSENEAKDVMIKLNGKEIEGVKLNVKLYKTKYEQRQYLENSQRLNEENYKCNLHIRNIPLTAKEEDLVKVFSKYGNITSVRIEKNKIEKKEGEDNKVELVSKGFGYLSFDNPESAQNAIDDLNGKYLPGFESWSHTLIIEIFMTKYERQLIDNKGEDLSFLSYFTNQNTQENKFNNFSVNIPQIYQPQFIQMPIMPYNQFNQIEQFSQINQFNQFNQYNHYRNFPNQRFNYNQINNNQYMNYNNNFRNNYNFQRGRGYRGNYHRNNRTNSNYNNHKKNHQQKNLENENKNNKIDLSEYYKLTNPEEQKEYLGDLIFKSIENSKIMEDKKNDIDTIGKITGMILELPDRNEIIEILENSSILNNRIEEALNLLNWKS
jgi:RNA recognition motif-containing protein